MKKSPWYLWWLSLVLGLVVAFGTYASRVEQCVATLTVPCEPASWLFAVALWLKPYALATILGATVLALILQASEKAFAGHGFRKAQVEKFLNEIVRAQLKNEARHHRLTLFRTVRGPRAKLIAWYRLREQEDPAEKQRKREALRAIKWTGTYLYVYARASKAPSKRSGAVWQVYHNRGGSAGVAGRAWDEREVVIIRDLPRITPASLSNVKSLADADSAVRQYATLTNIDDIVHIRAMRHVARHFIGIVIEKTSGEPWGVLLVDSMKDQCPFPGGAKEKTFKKQFRDHATMLSLLLS